MPRVLPLMKISSTSRPYFLNSPASLAIQYGAEEPGESEMYAKRIFSARAGAPAAKHHPRAIRPTSATTLFIEPPFPGLMRWTIRAPARRGRRRTQGQREKIGRESAAAARRFKLRLVILISRLPTVSLLSGRLGRRRMRGEFVQPPLQLAAGQDARAFDRMVDELAQKFAHAAAEAVDHEHDFHRPIHVAQIEDGFGHVDQRAARDHHGAGERLLARPCNRRGAVARRDDFVPGRDKAFLQELMIVPTHQQDLSGFGAGP